MADLDGNGDERCDRLLVCTALLESELRYVPQMCIGGRILLLHRCSIHFSAALKCFAISRGHLYRETVVVVVTICTITLPVLCMGPYHTQSLFESVPFAFHLNGPLISYLFDLL